MNSRPSRLLSSRVRAGECKHESCDMTTKQKIINHMKRRHRNVQLRTRSDALTPADRQRATARSETINLRLAEIDAERKTIPQGTRDELIRMARFVVDVNGDPAAVEKLAAVLELVELAARLSDERKLLDDEKRKLWSRLSRRQHEVSYRDGMFTVIAAGADTLTELLEKVQAE